MRQLVLLCYSIVLFSLTTFILVYFAFFHETSLQTDQAWIIGFFSFLGYAATSLAFYVWYDNRKNTDYEDYPHRF